MKKSSSNNGRQAGGTNWKPVENKILLEVARALKISTNVTPSKEDMGTFEKEFQAKRVELHLAGADKPRSEPYKKLKDMVSIVRQSVGAYSADATNLVAPTRNEEGYEEKLKAYNAAFGGYFMLHNKTNTGYFDLEFVCMIRTYLLEFVDAVPTITEITQAHKNKLDEEKATSKEQQLKRQLSNAEDSQAIRRSSLAVAETAEILKDISGAFKSIAKSFDTPSAESITGSISTDVSEHIIRLQASQKALEETTLQLASDFKEVRDKQAEAMEKQRLSIAQTNDTLALILSRLPTPK